MVTKLNKYGEVLMVLGKKNTPGIWLINDDNSGFIDKKSMPLFDKPADIAFDSDDNIYVADGYGNNRVVKFNKNGKYLLEWGNKGSAMGQFNLPHGLTIDSIDNVYVADRENARIQIFDSNGNFINLWDKIGYPYGIKYYKGYVYMTDARNEKVKKIDLNGNILWEIGSPGKGSGEFGWAHGIDISKDGIIYISEILNWRVQILKVTNENN
jgi:DNA-binding beta-propeller fold protein YncE